MYIKKEPEDAYCSFCGYRSKCVLLIEDAEFMVSNGFKVKICYKCWNNSCNEIQEIIRKIENEELLG